MSFKDRIIIALSKLGDSTEHWADTLKKQGVRGIKNNCQECPLARYLTRELGTAVEVDADEIIVADTGEEVRNSDNVNAFIRRFDKGDFPDLDLR